ncbi:MAG: exosortase/archaeosortase family protein [Leptospirillum sp.]
MTGEKIALLIASGTVVVLSWANILKLIDDWNSLPSYSHGFLVPFVALLLLYLDKEHLKKIQDQPSIWGIALIGMGVVCLLVGTWSGLDFIRQISILFLIAGIVVGYWGLRTLKAVRFPLLYLLFMIPLPFIVFNSIAFPLQMMAAEGASNILNGIQIPVFREGTIIHLPHISLGVEKACSGIQSLVSLLAISVLMKKLADFGGITGVLFALSAIPIAILANMMRIAGTGILGSFVNPHLAEGFFHLFSGWVVFLFAFLTLFLEVKAIRLLQKRRQLETL